MSTIAQTRRRKDAHQCRRFSTGRGSLYQSQYLDCGTSVELHRLLHVNITKTGRSPYRSHRPVLLNPISSHRLTRAATKSP